MSNLQEIPLSPPPFPILLADNNLSQINVDVMEKNSQNLGWPLVSIIVFYTAILAVGLFTAWKNWNARRSEGLQGFDSEDSMLAGRNIGIVVGILTMGATWVGGAFINGSAETVYSSGLLNTIAPIGYSLALIIAGVFFAKKMRKSQYITMVDPFMQKYGRWGALQALIAATSEIMWSAATLSALGSTLEVILNIEAMTSIIISAVIVLIYTLFGGLRSVAYTDVIQIFFILFGLILSIPFMLSNKSVNYLSGTQIKRNWLGHIESHLIGEWIDIVLLCLMGGIPWQAYFQRVLSSKTSNRASWLSYGGALVAILMAIPPSFIGIIALYTDWSTTNFGHTPNSTAETKLILPLCMQYLTPSWVAFFGLGAISAAVMSSADSSMLSASCLITRNIYQQVFRKQASEKEIGIILWIMIIINCICATGLAVRYQSVYELFVLCGDLVYVLLFPQLVLVLYLECANTYGSVSSFFVGLILRVLYGDSTLGISRLISFGSISIISGSQVQSGDLPFRSIIMIISFTVHWAVSQATRWFFSNKKIASKYDFFGVYTDKFVHYSPENNSMSTLECNQILEPPNMGNNIQVNQDSGRNVKKI